MKTKDLLLSKLSNKGFIYYPSIKRLMFKNADSVIVIEMGDDKKCRVYSNISDKLTRKNNVNDLYFAYDTEKIINHIDNFFQSQESLKTAA